jgi:hypothetical protein
VFTAGSGRFRAKACCNTAASAAANGGLMAANKAKRSKVRRIGMDHDPGR